MHAGKALSVSNISESDFATLSTGSVVAETGIVYICRGDDLYTFTADGKLIASYGMPNILFNTGSRRK